MKTTELRIGNYVIDLDGSVTQIASGMDIDGCWKPVPINDKWLENFGFIYHKDRKFWRIHWGKNGTEIVCPRGDEYYFGLGIGYLREFKYVHQLQNIYFALTAEELVKK